MSNEKLVHDALRSHFATDMAAWAATQDVMLALTTPPPPQYGAIHTDGSRSGGQPVGTNAVQGDVVDTPPSNYRSRLYGEGLLRRLRYALEGDAGEFRHRLNHLTRHDVRQIVAALSAADSEASWPRRYS